MTAKEFLQENNRLNDSSFELMMIEFAKYHVQKLAENPSSLLTDFGHDFLQEGIEDAITTESILEAYPLENIK